MDGIEPLEEQIKHRHEQDELNKYFESKLCAEDFDGPDSWQIYVPRAFTEKDRQISLNAKAFKEKTQKEWSQAFHDYIMRGGSHPSNQYARMMMAIHNYAEIIKKHGEY